MTSLFEKPKTPEVVLPPPVATVAATPITPDTNSQEIIRARRRSQGEQQSARKRGRAANVLTSDSGAGDVATRTNRLLGY